MNDTTLLAVGGVLLLILGAAIGYVAAIVRQRTGESRADAIQTEFDAYRESVAGHFQQTAVQFQNLGEQYKALYEHLAEGAQSLCDTPTGTDAIGFSTPAQAGGKARMPECNKSLQSGYPVGSIMQLRQ